MARLPLLALTPVILFAAYAAGGSSADAQDINDRVKRLEQKTDYYLKKNRKVRRLYTRPRSTASAAPQMCAEDIPLGFNPMVVNGGTAHAWLSATIQFSGTPRNVFVNWAPVGFGFPCGKAEVTEDPAGTVTLKQYCSFDVSEGDKFIARFGVGNGCADANLRSIDATMKFTLVEVIEPP